MSDQQKENYEKAMPIIKRYVAFASGTSLIPVPGVELIAVPGFQLAMVRELAKLYDQEFSEQLGKSLIASLIGLSFATATVRTLASLIKIIPLVGQVAGVAASGVLSAATTYAVGKVFVLHFETGGTMLTFDPEKMKEHYKKFYNEAKSAPAGQASYAGAKP